MHFSQITEEFRSAFHQLVKDAEFIVITSHYSPDDDSIGSTLAMYQLLTQQYPYKNIQIYYTGDPAERWQSFTNYSDIQFESDIITLIDQSAPELLIMLDGSEYTRFSHDGQVLQQKIQEYQVKTICIDHHKNLADNFDLHLQVTDQPACASLIYQTLWQDQPLTQPAAESLLLGIIGDTGNMEYLDPSQSYIFDIVKTLQETAHVNIQSFKARYSPYSKKLFHALQTIIPNTEFLDFEQWPSLQLAFITEQQVKDLDLSANEVSALKDQLYYPAFQNMIKGYPWTVFLYPKLQTGDVSISLRSLPEAVNVRHLVQTMGIGGGHDLAAGGTFKSTDGQKLTVEDSKQQLVNWLETNRPNSAQK